MFFTHEDYRKIEEYLKRKSIKDTQFNEAITPLDGTEEVAFVQKGKNVKAHVKDIVDQLFLLGVSDFLNITDKYHQSYIDLKEAIDLIPFLARKKGQVITFINKSGDWVIYQFKGHNLLQWDNTTLWVNLFESIYINSILPDEEDLTVTTPDEQGNVRLQFKDKLYDAEDFSGLGRVYLRKNMVEGKNVLLQEMVAEANTIYHIQYDYDLNGQEITIPENCVLKFEGGSLSNGTLNGNNTFIPASILKTYFYNVVFNNSFYSDRPCPEIFGGTNSDAIQSCINVFKSCIFSSNVIYSITKDIIFPSNTVLKGEQSNFLNFSDNGRFVLGARNQLSGLNMYCESNRNIILIDLNYIDTSQDYAMGNANISLLDCSIYGKKNSSQNQKCIIIRADQIDSKGLWGIKLNNITIASNWEYGISIEVAKRGWITDCSFTNVKMNECINGFYIGKIAEETSTGEIGKISLNNCSLQSYDYTKRFIFIDKGRFIHLNDCMPWDWDSVNPAPYLIGSDIANVKLSNCYYAERVEYLDSNVIQNVYIQQFESSSGGIKSYGANSGYLKESISDGDVATISDLLKIKEGTYSIPSSSKIRHWLGIESFNAYGWGCDGILLVKDDVSLKRKLLRLYIGDIFAKSNNIGGWELVITSATTEISWRKIQLKELTFANKSEYHDYFTTNNIYPQNKPIVSINGKLGTAIDQTVVYDAFGRKMLDSYTLSNYDIKRLTSEELSVGQSVFNSTYNKTTTWNGEKWIEYDGTELNTRRTGTFAQKPLDSNGIPIGFAYFCTDKQTSEGVTRGIMIYYKGNNVWVDALGRIVDDDYPTINIGTTEQRPTLGLTNEGFEYYDSTLKKKILWNGTEWTNLDGTPLE